MGSVEDQGGKKGWLGSRQTYIAFHHPNPSPKKAGEGNFGFSIPMRVCASRRATAVQKCTTGSKSSSANRPFLPYPVLKYRDHEDNAQQELQAPQPPDGSDSVQFPVLADPCLPKTFVELRIVAGVSRFNLIHDSYLAAEVSCVLCLIAQGQDSGEQ